MRNGEAVDIGPTDGRSGLMARLRERNLLDPPEISDEEEERQWQERLSELEHMRQEELAHLERKWQQRELQKVALAFGAIDATEHERLRVSELSDDLWWEVHQPPLENADTLELTQIQMKWHHRRQHPHDRAPPRRGELLGRQHPARRALERDDARDRQGSSPASEVT